MVPYDEEIDNEPAGGQEGGWTPTTEPAGSSELPVIPGEEPSDESGPSPAQSLAARLVGATGVGGAGFQRYGTEGAAPWRTPAFLQGRSTAEPVLPSGVSVGSPVLRGGVGEMDDEARALRAGRLARMR